MKKLIIIVLFAISTVAQSQSGKPPKPQTLTSVKMWNNTVYQFFGQDSIPSGSVIFPPGSSNILPNSNVAIGDSALVNLTSGRWNTAANLHALRSNTTGDDNVAIGWDALYHNTTGNANIAIVEDALFNNISGRDNIALGRGAQYSHQSPTNNVNIGYNTSYFQIRGVENTGVGAYALGFMEGGYGVTALGAYAGEMNAAGAGKTIFNSIYIGYCAGLNSMFSNSILIGANTEVTGDRQLNIGKAIYGENIGLANSKIKIANDFEVGSGRIMINGVQYNFSAALPAVGSVLTYTGNGNVEWITPTITTQINNQSQRLAVVDPYGKLIGYVAPMK